MTTATPPIAFLGLGRMGLPMSRNLATAGFAVRAWNRSPRPAPDLPNYTLAVQRVARDAPRPWLTTDVHATIESMFVRRDPILCAASHLTVDATLPVDTLVDLLTGPHAESSP
jgi:UDP-N-acetylmuramoylalanine-D-glutamate ligase